MQGLRLALCGDCCVGYARISHLKYMSEEIRHEGVVLSVSGQTAHVRIVQASACNSCAARSMCMSSESQEKEMDALMLEPMQSGDRVEVMVAEKLGWKAVLLAYIMPFVVMLAVIALLLGAEGIRKRAPRLYVAVNSKWVVAAVLVAVVAWWIARNALGW